ncbi:MAG: HypC/HybG/HupF family hydrogenase formation chaperone [Planctomycetaceae bacterium]|nr:HypC/HybG/HupF family hydrogenase formation chaperone [Planctomycetales bacterium]MCB9927106.1 HypC/HybG/HupF family hydrogenase formation chaperone [Planctomycetaceae bacterium]
MCLAVPGKLTEWIEREPPFAEGIVEFAGVRRKTNLSCVPEARAGDFVLVHAGVAITQIGDDEASRILEAFQQLALNIPHDEESTP